MKRINLFFIILSFIFLFILSSCSSLTFSKVTETTKEDETTTLTEKETTKSDITTTNNIQTECEHKHTHTYQEILSQATCTMSGEYDEVLICDDCNKEISRETVIVEPLGHNIVTIEGYPATEENTGLTDGEKCDRCGKIITPQEVIPKLTHVHEYVYVEAKDATLFSAGFKAHYECSSCHKYFDDKKEEVTYESLIIPELEHDTIKSLSELDNDKDDALIVGKVIGFTYDGTSAHTDRHGFLVIDNSSNDCLLINGIDKTFNEYKDKSGNSIVLGSYLVIKGDYKKKYNYPDTSQFYKSIITTESNIEIVEHPDNFNIDTKNLVSVQSLSDFSELTDNSINNLPFGTIVRFVGTKDNPIEFSASSGSVSGYNMYLYYGNPSSKEDMDVLNKYLVIAPKSLSALTKIDSNNLYNQVYSFESNSPTTVNSDFDNREISKMIGSMYLAISEITTTNIILSPVLYDSWTLSDVNSDYEFDQAVSNIVSHYGITFDCQDAYFGGIERLDIKNYIKDFDSDLDYLLEIQDGKLVYVGSDEKQIRSATNKGLEIKESKKDYFEAVRIIAYLYYYNQNQIQYDQLNKRRQINILPEFPTENKTAYLDCSSYVNSVFNAAFGINFSSSYNTASLEIYSKSNQSNKDVLYYVDTKDYTTKEAQTALLNEIRSILQAGDIINYRHGASSGSSGHVMIYVGNGYFLHCTGSSFSVNNSDPSLAYDQATTTEKEVGGVQLLKDTEVFKTTSSSRYLFNDGSSSASAKVWSFSVMRPIYRSDVKTLTEYARLRLNNPSLNIEKTSDVSHRLTVNRDEEITYTITISNMSSSISYDDVVVSDVISAYTVITKNDTGTVNGNNISWTIDIPQNATVTIVYKVKVKNDAPYNTKIDSSSATVNGISTNEIYHYVSKYTDQNRTSLEEYALSKIGSSYTNSLVFINHVYSNIYNIHLKY